LCCIILVNFPSQSQRFLFLLLSLLIYGYRGPKHVVAMY
jgi:hypothetical protein